MTGAAARLALVCAALLAPGLLAPGRAGAADALKVGFVTTLTGAPAVAGYDMLDGFKLALKHTLGRLGNVETELVPVDDKGRPDVARQAVERLVHDHAAFVVAAAGDPAVTEAVAAAGAAAGIFVLNVGDAPPLLSGRGCGPWFFSLAGTRETAHEAMAITLTGRRLQRLVGAAPDNPAGHRAVESFRRLYHNPLTELWSKPGTMSFQDDMVRIRALKADGTYLAHTGGMAVEFVRQYAEAGLADQAPLFGAYTTFDQTVLPALDPEALGVMTVGPWVEDLDPPTNRRLVTEFEAEFGHPPSTRAAFGYDAVLLLDAAVRAVQGKVEKADDLRNALRRTEFPSVRGPFRFDSDQFPVQTLYLRQVVRGAKGRLTHESRGVVLKDYHEPRLAECPMRW